MKTQKQLGEGRMSTRARKDVGSNKSEDPSVTDGEAGSRGGRGSTKTLGQTLCSRALPGLCTVYIPEESKFHIRWMESHLGVDSEGAEGGVP